METNLLTFIPIKEVIPFWPSDKFSVPGLENVGLSKYEFIQTQSGFEIEATVLFLDEIKVSIPGMDSFAFLIGRGDGFTEFDLEASLSDIFSAKLKDVSLRLQFKSDFFKPMKKVKDQFVPDPSRKFAEVSGVVSLAFDSQGNVSFEGGKTFGISKPMMIGDTGIIIETMQIAFNFDGKGLRPIGADENWRGLYIDQAILRLPRIFDGAIGVKQFGIGSGGISGTIDYSNPKGEKLFGLDAVLTRFALTLKQSIPVSTSIEGKVKLPFFEDWLLLSVSIGFDGNAMVKLANPKGASKLKIKEVLEFELTKVSFSVDEGLFTAKISGKLTPIVKLAGIDWPSFDIKDLSIDSNGRVKLEGGWQELRRPQTIKLAGVRIEVSKIGFGTTEDGRKWFGLNGAIRLVEGVSAGASVDGLKIIWDESGKRPTEVSFEGIGVDLKIPNVLDLKGSISYKDKRFVGKIKLTLHPLDKAKIDATLVVGETDKNPIHTYFAIYLAGEWNTGIPIGPVGLYGLAGLFSLNYAPNKKSDQAWYENPEKPENSEGWYKENPIGVTDLDKKWKPEMDSLSIGAGVTLGVLPMNGYPFNGRLLLVITFPGPIIMLEGRANLLKNRADLDDDPLFRALAVLDGRQGTFEFGLDAKYAYDKSGSLIDINGSAHGFFGAPDNWHLYIGQKTPKEKRIRASLFKLFQASAYFMIDNQKLQTGAWLGWAPKPLKFGPVQIAIEAWLDGNASINWQPAQFHGDLWLHGKIALQVFFIRLGLAVDAKIAADVFDPFYLMAMLGITVEIWPFPPLSLEAKLEWKPEKVTWPPLPLPLKEISIAHPLVSTNWLLPRESVNSIGTPLLIPNHESKDKGLIKAFYNDSEFNMITLPKDTKTREKSPVVPLDARLHLSFNQPVHDNILVGNNSNQLPEYLEIGDPERSGQNPMRVKFSLIELNLQKWENNQWVSVGSRSIDSQSKLKITGRSIYGSWAPIPRMSKTEGLEQTKLWLWSETPFDYTQNSGKSLERWYTNKLKDAPCVAVPDKRNPEIYLFSMLNRGETLSGKWKHQNNPNLSFSWSHPQQMEVSIFQDIQGITHALSLPSSKPQGLPNILMIHIPHSGLEPHFISEVQILATDEEAISITGDGHSVIESKTHTPHPDLGVNTHLFKVNIHASTNQPIRMIGLQGGSKLHLLRVTLIYDISAKVVTDYEQRQKRVEGAIETFNQVGQILEPHSYYRIKVKTMIATQGKIHPLTEPKKTPEITREIAEYAYFRTEGPPGLSVLALPAGMKENSKNPLITGLDSLSEYVAQTTPPTINKITAKKYHPKPFYRGYDISVQFKEKTNYVDLMYRLAGRDLMLYLYDNNSNPVRDLNGGLVVFPVSWNKYRNKSLLSYQQRFLTLLKNCSKKNFQSMEMPLTMAAEELSKVLQADTVYNAVLKPLIFHDSLSQIDTGKWAKPIDDSQPSKSSKWTLQYIPSLVMDIKESSTMAIQGDDAWKDRGTSNRIGLNASVSDLIKLSELISQNNVNGGEPYTLFLDDDRRVGSKTYLINRVLPGDKRVIVEGKPLLNKRSRWSIQLGIKSIVQLSNIWGGSNSYSKPKKNGTILPLQIGKEWDDYRFSITLRSFDDDAIGVAFRLKDQKNYYLFTMDRQRRYRRLVRVHNDQWTILAKDNFVYQKNIDYQLTVEILKEKITVYFDGQIIFSLSDKTFSKGRIGLYCWANTGASYRKLSVDDLSPDAKVVYQFPFTTSLFRNFFHHLHSFQEKLWIIEAGKKPQWKNASVIEGFSKDKPSISLATKSEIKSYDSITRNIFKESLPKKSHCLEVSKIVDKDKKNVWALFFNSPEPLDWQRLQLRVQSIKKEYQAFLPSNLVDIKLINVLKKGVRPQDEVVQILLNKEKDLSGFRLEYLRFPDSTPIEKNKVLLRDSFESTIEEDSLKHSDRKILWKRSENEFLMNSEFLDAQGKLLEEEIWSLKGAVLCYQKENSSVYSLISKDNWFNYQLSVDIGFVEKGSFSVVFGYHHPKKYFALTLKSSTKKWQLIKVGRGSRKVVKSGVTRNSFKSYKQLRLRQQDTTLIGYWGREKLFEAYQLDIVDGRIGFLCESCTGLKIKEIEVVSYQRHIGKWQIHDRGNPRLGPSIWKVENGSLWQRSNIWFGKPTFKLPEMHGTFVINGEFSWADYQINVWVRSDDNDAIGVIVRFIDPRNYYLLVADQQQNYLRFVKVVDGNFETLWPTEKAEKIKIYERGIPFLVQIKVYHSTISAHIDGKKIFNIKDKSFLHGKIGLFSWANTGASYQNVEVTKISKGNVLFEDTFQQTKKWYSLNNNQLVSLDSDSAEVKLENNQQIWMGPKKWRDFSVSLNLRLAKDYHLAGIFLRYQDKKNYYQFLITKEKLELVCRKDNKSEVLWQGDVFIESENYYQCFIKVQSTEVNGGSEACQFDIFIDGVKVCRICDKNSNPISNGSVAFLSGKNTRLFISEVVVYDKPKITEEKLFHEKFETLDKNIWIVDDQALETKKPSKWSVVGGEVMQTSNIYGYVEKTNRRHLLGTHLLAGTSSWKDYRLCAEVRSDDDDAIGLLFCYKNRRNYYRWYIDHQRKKQCLIKVSNGVHSFLWESKLSLAIKKWNFWTVDIYQGLIVSYINGQKIFEVYDQNFIDSGKIGLFCWANQKARFRNVEVIPAKWLSFHSFSNHSIEMAGTQMNIHTGLLPQFYDKNQIGFGIKHIDGGLSNNIMFSKLRHNKEILRVVDKEGKIHHIKSFVQEKKSKNIKVKIIRNVDATSFFMIPNTESVFKGNISCSFKYLKNAGSHLPVYKEGGSDKEEVCKINLDL